MQVINYYDVNVIVSNFAASRSTVFLQLSTNSLKNVKSKNSLLSENV